MATFLEVLPDPDFKINDAGIESASGTAGQGFANIKLAAEGRDFFDRTISGKLIHRRGAQNKWTVNLAYNPLTEEEFRPIKAFLLHRQSRGGSFYISLPQYKSPKDATFKDYVVSTSYSNITTTTAYTGGETSIVVTNSEWSGDTYTTTGLPYFGDLFTIEDSDDSLHSKVYMVSRVETPGQSETTPGAGNIRIHFSPGLNRAVSSGSILNFSSPLMRVYLTEDVQEYKLDHTNLYSYSVKLTEALY